MTEIATLDERRKKQEQGKILDAVGAKEPGTPNSAPPPATGIAAKPKTIDIGGIPHLDLPDQKYPGPLSMMADAVAGTVKHIASAPFDVSSRQAFNRSGLDASAEIDAEKKRQEKTAPTTPIAATPSTPINIKGMTADQRFNAADAYGSAVDKATGVSSSGDGGIAGLTKRFDTYAKNDDVRAMRNAREELLGSGIQFEKDANGKLLITNSGTFNPIAAATGSTINMKEGNDIMARANQARGEMIDSMIKANGGNGIATLPDYNEAANAEKTARWRQDELLQAAKYGNRAAGEVAQESMRGQNQMATEAIRGGTQLVAENNRNAVTMRGQDLTAQNEASRIAGNPVDNELKKAQTGGIAAQTESSKMIAEIQRKALAGDAQAAATYRALTGKSSEDRNRFMPATKKVYNELGQVVGEDIVPFDKLTGQQGGGGKQEAAGAADGAAKIRADMQAGKISRDDAIKQLKAMGYQ